MSNMQMITNVSDAETYIRTHFTISNTTYDQIKFIQKDGYVEVDAPRTAFVVKLNLSAFKLFFGDNYSHDTPVGFRVKFTRCKSMHVGSHFSQFSGENGPDLVSGLCHYENLTTDEYLPVSVDILRMRLSSEMTELRIPNTVSSINIVRDAGIDTPLKIMWKNGIPASIDSIRITINNLDDLSFIPKNTSNLMINAKIDAEVFLDWMTNGSPPRSININESVLIFNKPISLIRMVDFLSRCENIASLSIPHFSVRSLTTHESDTLKYMTFNALVDYKSSGNKRAELMKFAKKLNDRNFDQFS